MSLLSLCVDLCVGYTFTHVTTKIKFRAAEGNIDGSTKRCLFSCHTYSFSTFSTPKVSCVFLFYSTYLEDDMLPLDKGSKCSAEFGEENEGPIKQTRKQ